VPLKHGTPAKRVVDFRSGWALSWGRPMSRFTRYARSRVSSVTLIPKESPNLHSNQPLHIVCIFWHVTLIYSDKTKLQQDFFCKSEVTATIGVRLCESGGNGTILQNADHAEKLLEPPIAS